MAKEMQFSIVLLQSCISHILHLFQHQHIQSFSVSPLCRVFTVFRESSFQCFTSTLKYFFQLQVYDLNSVKEMLAYNSLMKFFNTQTVELVELFRGRKDHLWQDNHQTYKLDTAEWFCRFQPTRGGRQLGLSRPVRTETVNTAKAPALLSGTNRGRGCIVRGLTSLYPPVSLIEQKSFLLSLGLV